MMVRGRSIAAAAIACVVASGAAAQPRQPVPDFTVRDRAGQEIASRDVSTQDRWLLVYVSPDCTPCDSLTRGLARWSSAELIARTVIVIGAPPDRAAAFVEGRGGQNLAGIAWFADPEGSAAQALGVDAQPALFGIRAGQMSWRLSGVLNDPGALQSVVRTWVEEPR